ncbi:MAG: putative phage infection (PIP) family protein YhgE [Myxococcota bacterium]|jgi:uncharacterized phage infection (PIP) family protein YhgE
MIYYSLILLLACQEEVPKELDEVALKISQVSNEFAQVNEQLQQVADAATNESSVVDVLAMSKQLAESMEELLALLPEAPSSSSSSSPSSSSPKPDKPQSGDPQQLQPQENDKGPEDINGTGQRTPPKSIFQKQQQFGDWGQLPPRLEQALQHSNPSDMPLRYRRLLIKYHRQATEPLR